MITEKAYAKINLGLAVGAKLRDGYHEVKTLIMPIDIYDELSFEEIDEDIVLIDNTNIKVEDNLVYKAAKRFMTKCKIDKGVRIVLNKKVPSEAGLGGGSADAAAVLRGLNRLFQVGKTLDELASMGKKLGADVPACVYQTFCKCEGKGDEATVLNVDYPKLKVCIVKPPYGLSTKRVYEEYVDGEHQETNLMLENIYNGVLEGNFDALKSNLFNDLEIPAFSLEPELKELYKNIISMGYICKMSGSGTALFVLSKEDSFADLKEKIKYHTIIETQFK